MGQICFLSWFIVQLVTQKMIRELCRGLVGPTGDTSTNFSFVFPLLSYTAPRSADFYAMARLASRLPNERSCILQSSLSTV